MIGIDIAYSLQRPEPSILFKTTQFLNGKASRSSVSLISAQVAGIIDKVNRYMGIIANG